MIGHNNIIEGVIFKELVTHGDDRGFFRELIRVTDDFFEPKFGQLSHSLVQAGVIKAWHGHVYQSQWTYILNGYFQVVIYDARPKSVTYQKKIELKLGDGEKSLIYSMPPGVLHGYKCLKGPAHVIYVTSGTYDIDDEVRVALSELDSVHSWF